MDLVLLGRRWTIVILFYSYVFDMNQFSIFDYEVLFSNFTVRRITILVGYIGNHIMDVYILEY